MSCVYNTFTSKNGEPNTVLIDQRAVYIILSNTKHRDKIQDLLG